MKNKTLKIPSFAQHLCLSDTSVNKQLIRIFLSEGMFNVLKQSVICIIYQRFMLVKISEIKQLYKYIKMTFLVFIHLVNHQYKSGV